MSRREGEEGAGVGGRGRSRSGRERPEAERELAAMAPHQQNGFFEEKFDGKPAKDGKGSDIVVDVSQKPLDKGTLLYVLFCTLVAVLGPFSFGYAIGYTSPALAEMAGEMSLSIRQQSVFSSIVSVGAMAGAVSGGRLADQWGRRAALAIAAVPFTVGWVFIAFGHSFTVLCIGRVLTGFGTGVVSFAVPVYIAEIAPVQLRGRLCATNQLGIVVGILTVYALGLAFEWRLLACIGIYPAVLLLLGLPLLPESPRWLAKRGDAEQLERALGRLRGASADIRTEMAEIQKSLAALDALPRATLLDLGDPALRRPLLVGVGLMVLQQFSGVNAVMFYAGPIFSAVGYVDPNVPGLLLQGVQVATTTLTAGVMDKAGRRMLLIISASLMAVGCFTLGLSFKLEEWPVFTQVSEILALVSLLVYIVAFALGLGAIPWIIMSEIFPAHVRDLAGSLAVLTNWLSCFVVTLTFEDLLDWSTVWTFWLYALECLGIVLFVAVLVPETRGRTLEEIEASFKKPLELQLA